MNNIKDKIYKQILENAKKACLKDGYNQIIKQDNKGEYSFIREYSGCLAQNDTYIKKIQHQWENGIAKAIPMDISNKREIDYIYGSDLYIREPDKNYVCRWDLDDIFSDNIIYFENKNLDSDTLDLMIDDYLSDKSHSITDYDEIKDAIEDSLHIGLPISYSDKKPSDFMQMLEKTEDGYKPLPEFISLTDGKIYTEEQYIKLLGTIKIDYEFATSEDYQRGAFNYNPNLNWHKLSMQFIPKESYKDCDGIIPPTVDDIRQEWLEEDKTEIER